MNKTKVWSCGGGVQSTAIAVLIITGKLPKPDLSCIIDTEREKSSTWEYLLEVTQPALARAGVNLEIIAKSRYAKMDLYTNKDHSLLIPAFTTIGDKLGKLSNFCSKEWKQYCVERWLAEKDLLNCEQWIGISIDEMRRVRVSRKRWLQNRYPLIELGLARTDCLTLVREFGWPVPPRSSCWMCPNMQNDEWHELKTEAPEDFAKAIELEREIREIDSGVYLHRAAKTIDKIDFQDTNEKSPDDNSCSSGLCFV